MVGGSKRAGLFCAALAAALAVTMGSDRALATTTGHYIYNLSSDTLRLVKVQTTAKDAFDTSSTAPDPPREGDVLKPGQVQHVEINNFLGRYAQYARANLFYAPLSYVIVTGAFDAPFCVPRGIKCRDARDDRSLSDKLLVVDPPGSTHRIKVEDRMDQRDALTRLCTKENNCDFTPTNRNRGAFTPQHTVGNVLINCPGNQVRPGLTIHTEDKVSNTDSVGIEASAGFDFFKLFEAKIKVSYGHENTREHTFAQDVAIPGVEPGTKVWIEANQPVIRDTGTYTLTLGQTRWIIDGVWIESPDPDRAGAYTVRQAALTADDISRNCGGAPAPAGFLHADRSASESAGLLQADPSTILAERAGTRRADHLKGGAESNTLAGGKGQDIILGGPGHDTLTGGNHDDLLKGQAGDDTLLGGSGADTIIDRTGATIAKPGRAKRFAPDTVNVRDGQGDDTVICRSGHSIVFADRGDRVSAKCGTVVRGARRKG